MIKISNKYLQNKKKQDHLNIIHCPLSLEFGCQSCYPNSKEVKVLKDRKQIKYKNTKSYLQLTLSHERQSLLTNQKNYQNSKQSIKEQKTTTSKSFTQTYENPKIYPFQDNYFESKPIQINLIKPIQLHMSCSRSFQKSNQIQNQPHSNMYQNKYNQKDTEVSLSSTIRKRWIEQSSLIAIEEEISLLEQTQHSVCEPIKHHSNMINN